MNRGVFNNTYEETPVYQMGLAERLTSIAIISATIVFWPLVIMLFVLNYYNQTLGEYYQAFVMMGTILSITFGAQIVVQVFKKNIENIMYAFLGFISALAMMHMCINVHHLFS